MKIIIIGAGASGLMAANILVKSGVEVIMLEASDRIGGRIYTTLPPGFTNHIEAGAEFIHGNLPLTLRLMRQAALPIAKVTGEMCKLSRNGIRSGIGEGKSWERFYKAMHAIESDCTVQDLLSARFAGKKYEALRLGVGDMAQGLDLADISRLSVFSVRDEWSSDKPQYRPVGGYKMLLEWLYNDTVCAKFELKLNTVVTTINWKPGSVKVLASDAAFRSEAVLLTLPVVNYMSDKLTFIPNISSILQLFEDFGFGEVIKIALEFKYPFWEESHPEVGFLFTGSGFTFWMQIASRSPGVVCWLGNDHASKYSNVSDAELLDLAVIKFGEAFKMPAGDIAKLYAAGKVYRYTQDSYFGGGYSWRTPESTAAIRKINQGVDKTIWFAGEALYPKTAATVEAALQSGSLSAKRILRNFGI